MKTILSFVAVLFLTLSVNAQEFKFETETIDYGKIAQGSNGERTYNFTNIGDAPLIIKTIKYDCCAIVKGPEKPIMPGEKGTICIRLDTERIGVYSKVFTVYSNTKTERKTLKFKANVVKP